MMRRPLVFLSLFVLALSSCSATLRMRATAPLLDNDSASCTTLVPVAVPVGAPRVMHFAWSGPASGEDSVVTTAGTLIVMNRGVPAGTYVVRAWASDAGGPGCDTTTTIVAKAPPWKPSL